MEDPQRCLELFNSDPSIVYLSHEAKQIIIRHEDGYLSKLKVWGSPYSPAHGFWAFGYTPETASQLWDSIPLDSDIVVAHTPAKFHRDECSKRGTAGCEVLRQTLWRVRPRLFVCGHIHEAFGVEVVSWDMSSPNVRFKEKYVREHPDPEPGSKKQYTVDLSSRAKSLALQNDGSTGNITLPDALTKFRGVEVDGPTDSIVADEKTDDPTDNDSNDVLDEQNQNAASGQGSVTSSIPDPPRPSTPPFPGFEKAERPINSIFDHAHIRHLGTRGQGGPTSSPRADQEVLSGREGRMETCIANAAFMGSNFPHKGGKKFHKPIVIDLDLPILSENEIDRPREPYTV